jgi:XTP/dITP diphosphohydrolase
MVPGVITLCVATRNARKVGELRGMLPSRVHCISLRDLGPVPDVVEDAPTFHGNAMKKAMALARWLANPPASARPPLPLSGLWVLADDSGLEVDALDGAPGVYSARFAALDDPSRQGNSIDADNNSKLLRLLSGVPEAQRTARFRCALALVPASSPEAAQVFDGTCEGHIALNPEGVGGFGYDPLFIPSGHTHSFATLGAEVKNGISHRARALSAMMESWSALRPAGG